LERQLNGWMVLLIVLVFALGYGFAALNTRLLIPAATAQIASNQGLVAQLNQALKQYEEADAKWKASVETRLGVLENKR